MQHNDTESRSLQSKGPWTILIGWC